MATARNQIVVVDKAGNPEPYKIGHFSHRHWLYRYQVQPGDNFDCAICNLPCSGDVMYRCKPCGYYLHGPCFMLPQKVQHKCHRHPLTLRSTPIYDSGEFRCKGCGEDGCGFNYNCTPCQYDLHVACASLPETLSTGFNYKINLYYSFPIKNEAAPVYCRICNKVVDKKRWVYYNRGTDFFYHVSCAFSERYDGEDVEELISDASCRLGLLELEN